ncbi:MAG: cadherin-like domain-containing protein [Anaerolineales bacterium]|nr:cadherin-like domain-containing protein [Anaerolineales bacterium]
MATVLGKQAGESFHFVLNNTILKDNRIPPRGFTNPAFDRPGMRPIGATYADGQHWDDLNFVLPAQTTRVRATLYYQLSSKEYVDFLRTMGGPDGVTLGTMWDDLKSPPEAMAAIDVTYGVPTPTPTASRTPAPTATATSTRTPTPTVTQTPKPGVTTTATPTATPTATRTPAPASTRTPTPTPTGTPSGTGNTAPRAVEDHAIVKTGVTLSLDVLANDVDPDPGDVLTLVAVEPPSTGVANVKGNRLVFTPKPGFEGEIRLEYRIRDRGGLEATAPVVISVSKVLQFMPQVER